MPVAANFRQGSRMAADVTGVRARVRECVPAYLANWSAYCPGHDPSTPYPRTRTEY